MAGCKSPNPQLTKEPISMHPTYARLSQQQQRVNAHRSASDSLSFFNLLTSDLLLGKLENLLPAQAKTDDSKICPLEALVKCFFMQ